MIAGLSRDKLEETFNERLKVYLGQIEAVKTGENPELAAQIFNLPLGGETGVVVRFIASAILDTIAENNKSISST